MVSRFPEVSTSQWVSMLVGKVVECGIRFFFYGRNPLAEGADLARFSRWS